MNKLLLSLSLIALCALAGCKTPKINPYNYEASCMGTGADGLQLLKVYSYGENTSAAVAQAKKNAVHAAIFKGIPGQGCSNFALLKEPGAQERYKAYFEDFFSPNGAYLRFVSISNDGSIDPTERTVVGGQVKVGVSIVLQYAALRTYLEQEGIVRSLNSGF